MLKLAEVENKGISDFKFYSFIRNNNKEQTIYDPDFETFIEDNNAMTESYLMIAPDGRLFQNGGAQYKYSRPLFEVPFVDALNDITFKQAKYDARYAQNITKAAVDLANTFFCAKADTSPKRMLM